MAGRQGPPAPSTRSAASGPPFATATARKRLAGGGRLPRMTDSTAAQRTPLGPARHGESEWNAKNLFTGWVDVDLTAKGEAEAARGGTLLADAGLLPDVLHTSVQRRAIRTAQLALDAATGSWIPVQRSWRLNERHYGALPGQGQEGDPRRVRRGAVHALAPFLRHPAAAARRRRRILASPRPALRRPAAGSVREPSASRTSSSGCCRTGTTRSSPTCAPVERARRGARQLAARPGQAPRRHQRRRHRRAQHPDRDPAASTGSTRTCARRSPAGSTSTRTLPRRRSRRSRTRVAEGHCPGPGVSRHFQPASEPPAFRP